jgi:adenylylsulfate kinase
MVMETARTLTENLDMLSPQTTDQRLWPRMTRSHLTWHEGVVSASVRQGIFKQRPATIWLTGYSGAGKSTLAYELEKNLLESGQSCYVLDGDNLRHHLNADLGFSVRDRKENIRRTAEVAHLMNEAGLIVITALISPLRADREMAREVIGKKRFIEVHVSTPMTICEKRDPKGLYRKARSGQIQDFTGISAPYEEPLNPALELDTGALSLAASSHMLFDYLIEHQFL